MTFKIIISNTQVSKFTEAFDEINHNIQEMSIGTEQILESSSFHTNLSNDVKQGTNEAKIEVDEISKNSNELNNVQDQTIDCTNSILDDIEKIADLIYN